MDTLSGILIVLQSVVSLLTSTLQNPQATLTQKREAIAQSQVSVMEVQNALRELSYCRTDTQFGRQECSHPVVDQSPLVYLEGELHRGGQVISLKGINRDSTAKTLGIQVSDVKDLNPYRVRGFYPTSSVSSGDFLVLNIFKNPNARANTICAASWGEGSKVLPTQQLKDTLAFNLSQGYGTYVEQSYNVWCSSENGVRQLTPYDSEPIKESSWDSITIDWVK